MQRDGNGGIDLVGDGDEQDQQDDGHGQFFEDIEAEKIDQDAEQSCDQGKAVQGSTDQQETSEVDNACQGYKRGAEGDIALCDGELVAFEPDHVKDNGDGQEGVRVLFQVVPEDGQLPQGRDVSDDKQSQGESEWDVYV